MPFDVPCVPNGASWEGGVVVILILRPVKTTTPASKKWAPGVNIQDFRPLEYWPGNSEIM